MILVQLSAGEKTSWDYMPEEDIVTLVGPLSGMSTSERRAQKGFDVFVERANAILSKDYGVLYAAKTLRSIAMQALASKKHDVVFPIWFEDIDDIDDLVERWLPLGRPKEKAFLSIVICLELIDFLSWKTLSPLFASHYPQLKELTDIEQMLQVFIMHGDKFVFVFRDSVFFDFLEYMVLLSQGKYLFCLSNTWKNVKEIKAHGDYYQGICRLLQHDEEHTSSISLMSFFFDMLKKDLQIDYVLGCLGYIKRWWTTRGLELVFASYLLTHEDFMGYALLNQHPISFAEKLLDAIENKWKKDNALKNILHKLLNGKDISHLRHWQEDLVYTLCQTLPNFNQEEQALSVCQRLSKSWGIPLSMDRDSQKALTFKVVNTICGLEEMSSLIKNFKEYIEHTFDRMISPLFCFALVDRPTETYRSYSVPEIAFFPLQESITCSSCSSAKRLMFLKMVLRNMFIDSDHMMHIPCDRYVIY